MSGTVPIRGRLTIDEKKGSGVFSGGAEKTPDPFFAGQAAGAAHNARRQSYASANLSAL
jgi:hypothetical protein